MTDTVEDVRKLARKFAQTEIQPHLDEDERAERFRPEWIRALGDLGLTGIAVDEKYGGAGLGLREMTAVIEELAAVSSAYAISVGVTGLPQEILQRFGSEAQRQKYIPPLASGHAIGSFSLSEAGSGSDAAQLRTTAKRDGNFYVLNGAKLWVTQADSAQTLVVMARTGEPGPKGISAFVVERGTPGLGMGKCEKKIALNTSHTMEVVFQDARIPAENLLGREGDGFHIAMTALDAGRINIAANALGVARSAISVAALHARQRQQFGRLIGDFQGVSFLLADAMTQWEAARLMVQRAATLFDLRDDHPDFTGAAAMAKLFSTDMAMKVTTDCVQILGGSGLTREFPVERYMREAKILQIVEGTNQIQRLVISRSYQELGNEFGKGSRA